ncbi:hypothetical protein ACMGDM_03530 [Sphingomonas sp. DT-51]|uniref:hypothetical protein n=1 Tax=Sphingomonas sp. DT-51 TaxID=3396165 RepID=UPI003F1E2744
MPHRPRLLACLLTFTAVPASATPLPTGWFDTIQGRLAADAALHALSDQLAARDSATLVLDAWCAAHHMATEPKIVAERVHGDERTAPPEVRALLKVAPDERLGYRHVRLRCGTHVLSDADNWYVPARLTADINHQLDTTETPFGRAAQPLHFRRYTLSSHHLWSPLPQHWETLPGWRWPLRGEIDVPATVLENRAVLLLPDGSPVSAVVERYTGAVLAFPAPPVAR